MCHHVQLSTIPRIHSALRVQKQLTTNRPQSLEAQRKELNMALVLICIVVLFILCQSVKIVPDVYEALVCRRQQVSKVVRYSQGHKVFFLLSPRHVGHLKKV